MTTAARKAPAHRSTARKAPAKRKATKWTTQRAWDEFRNWSTLAFWAALGGYWTMTTHKILFPAVILVAFVGIVAMLRRASR